HGLTAGRGRRRDERRNLEVALGRLRWTDADRPVGQTHVQRVLVDRRVDGDRFDVVLVQGPDDPHGNLPAVCDQDAPEHQRASSGAVATGSSSNRSWPNSTGSALRTWIVRTTPATSALIS